MRLASKARPYRRKSRGYRDSWTFGLESGRNGCGKLAHPSRKDAKSAAKRTGGGLHEYHCDRCGFWHIGHLAEQVLRGEVASDAYYDRRTLAHLGDVRRGVWIVPLDWTTAHLVVFQDEVAGVTRFHLACQSVPFPARAVRVARSEAACLACVRIQVEEDP